MLSTILSKFFSLFHSILMLDARRQVRAKYTSSRRYVSIREHHRICVFITNLYIITIFYLSFMFSHLFIHISIFSNPKDHFSTIELGRSWEVFDWFVSFMCTSSSFHLSFLFSKSKNTQKIFSDFNLLTFTLWIRPQLATVLNLNLNLKI